MAHGRRARAWVAALCAAGAMAACVSSKTFVLHQTVPGTTHHGLVLKPLECAIKVDQAAQDDFKSKLAAKLKSATGVDPSDTGDLIVQYRFVLFEQGSTAARLASGAANLAGSPLYGIGDGSVGVEVIYARPDGTELGHIISDGPISGAFGSTSGALSEAAGAIAKYTKANFTCPECGAIGVMPITPSTVDGLKKM